MTRNLLFPPLKMLCPGTLLKNPDLNIDKKNIKKSKQTVFLLMASAFSESNLQ